jgi:hypothetical protein
VASYDLLEIEREKLSTNVESLKVINKELENTKRSLLYDKDTLIVYARELGYKLPNERFVRIVGFEGARRQRIEAGNPVNVIPPEHISEKAIKLCAFFIGMGSFLCILIPDILQSKASQRKKKKRKVYTPPQSEEQKKEAS